MRTEPKPKPKPERAKAGDGESGASRNAQGILGEPGESPIVLTFPAKGTPAEWHLRESKLAEYRQTFPHLDILAEFRKARQWAMDSPANRKTAGGMPRFLTGWLLRAKDSGKSREQNSRRGTCRRTAAERGEYPEPPIHIPEFGA